ncbi:hypothetical protein TNCV_4364791 [Trichonephila clavipes]|nr:hypothetical protein TNCV_4364791 [Trichonephila clavipes]
MRRYVPIPGQELRNFHATCHLPLRTTNDTDESRRKQELQKKGTRNRNKTRLVWFTVHECMRNRLKLQEEGEGESWLRGFKRLRPLCRIVGKFVFAIGDSENCLCLN